MKKQSFAILFAGVLSAGILSACGGYNNDSLDITDIDVDSYISELGSYENLSIETDEMMEVNDETVQQYIEYVLGNMGIIGKEEVDRPIETGDIVNIDYEGLKDGVAFEGGTAKGYDLNIGSGQFIAGFEDGLIGHSKGEEVALDLTFPEGYQSEELAGKAVVFNVKINSVNVSAAPKLTEDVIAKMGIAEVSNEEQLRVYVKENLEKNAKTLYDNALRDKVLKAVYDNTTFASDEVPAKLLELYVKQLKASDEQLATQYGTTLEEFAPTYYGKTFEEYEKNINEQAKVMIQNAMICEKIARDMKIKLTDKEVKEQMVLDVENYKYESIEAFKKKISEQDYKNYLLELKVLDAILENTTVTTKENTMVTTNESTTATTDEKAEK